MFNECIANISVFIYLFFVFVFKNKILYINSFTSETDKSTPNKIKFNYKKQNK